MALIIEDGTGVTGSDSFETVGECSDFALAYFMKLDEAGIWL